VIHKLSDRPLSAVVAVLAGWATASTDGTWTGSRAASDRNPRVGGRPGAAEVTVESDARKDEGLTRGAVRVAYR
jgi:hypothetical protein